MTYAWCTEHGWGPCGLLDDARRAHDRPSKKFGRNVVSTIMTIVLRDNPDHAAVFTRKAEPKDARECLRSAQRSARAKLTRMKRSK